MTNQTCSSALQVITPRETTTTQYEHPVEWSESDLHAILSQVRIQEQTGILDSAKPRKIVFFPEEIKALLPGLHHAFKIAQPSDHVVFALWVSSSRSQALEVTSGSLFVQGQMLHIILANHHERVTSEQDGIIAIRQKPFLYTEQCQRLLAL